MILVVVLLAGCSGVLSGEGDSPVATDSITETPTDAAPTTVSPTPSPTATPEPVDPDNPYGTEELVVGLNDSSARDVNRTAVVLSALAYWEENATEYAGYPVSFEYNESASDPDIEIRLVDGVDSCGLTHDPGNLTLGCSPVPTETARTPVAVRVMNNFTTASTARILKHELGHALGLDHDDEPSAVMAARMAAYPQSLEYTYTVVEDTDRHHPGAVNRQLAGAEEFLETGGGGTIASDMSVTEVYSEANADLTVMLTDDDRACSDDSVVCTEGSWNCLENGGCRGADSGVTLTLNQIKTEAIGWMVAYELFRAVALDGGALEWPTELDGEETDPTKSWWL